MKNSQGSSWELNPIQNISGCEREKDSWSQLYRASSVAVISKLPSAPLPWVQWLNVNIQKVLDSIPGWNSIDFSFFLSKAYINNEVYAHVAVVPPFLCTTLSLK